MFNRGILLTSIFAIYLSAASAAYAVTDPAAVSEQAKIEQKLNNQVDKTLQFADTDGTPTTLGNKFIKNRPVILTPVYYGCPSLCNQTLNGVTELLNQLELRLGEDFTVISFSINPREDSRLTIEKSANHYRELKKPESGTKGWSFLTAAQSTIDQLTSQIGFNYLPDGEDYIHAPVILVLTPEGKISRYFFGINYSAKEVHRALVEAAEGRIGTVADQIFLFCFRYDHLAGKYTFLVWNMTRAICITLVLILGSYLVWLRVQELRERKKGNA